MSTDYDHEAAPDKYAILFSPSTPRASPTLTPTPNLASSSVSAQMPQRTTRRSGSASDFGPFISVTANDDPLDSGFALNSPDEGKPPSLANQGRNSTFKYFEKFGEQARTEVDKKRHGLLEELLMHEDDPLYWVSTGAAAFEESPDHAELPHDAPTSTTDSTTVSLLDIDNDFFASPPSTSIPKPPTDAGHISSQHLRPMRSSSLRLSPSRIAPPLAVTRSTSSDSSSRSGSSSEEGRRDPSSFDEDSIMTGELSNRSSRASLSRLVSSLRSSASARAIPRRASVGSLFENAFSIHGGGDDSKNFRTDTLPRRSDSVSRVVPPDVNITHGTPFHSHRSPFAPHVFTPPSGAPGFTGDKYDWDRGFSDDILKEMALEVDDEKVVVSANIPEHIDDGAKLFTSRKGNKSADGEPTRKPKARKDEVQVSTGPSVGVAEFMERRMGNLELVGRKEMTEAVLTVELAELVRAHLPALARLPKKWTLHYSLDQHGISLKTLYSRCEAAMELKPHHPRPNGQMIVIKDAGDGVFGVWAGRDGVRMNVGKYYGTGECFLWKYVAGEDCVKAFKWTGKNDYVALCESGFISFGGGDGNYGLYLDETLFDGSSASCPTFANEPLCSGFAAPGNLVKFECVGLEVWGVGP